MRLGFVLIAAVASGCAEKVDLSSLTFACSTDADCVDGYVCQLSVCSTVPMGGGNSGTADGGPADAGTDGGGEPSEPTYLVGGSVVGFAMGPLVLELNGGPDLILNTGAPFTFPQGLVEGSAFLVTVKSVGTGQSCTVINGNGTVGMSNINNVQVRCTFSVSGGGGSIQDSLANVCSATSQGPVLELPIFVPSAYFTAAKVEVTLTNLQHPFGADLRAILEHTTTGSRVTLFDRLRNCTAEDIFSGDFKFSDSYAKTLCELSSPNTTAITSGSFLPCDLNMQATTLNGAPPNGFGGESMAGTWKLLIADMESGDVGKLDGWTLTFSPP
ncbi:MAG: proprotein convertase P-domain-containing protein [Myxococcaceae bacterium]